MKFINEEYRNLVLELINDEFKIEGRNDFTKTIIFINHGGSSGEYGNVIDLED